MIDDYVEIPLSGKYGQGRVILVDREDFPLVGASRWTGLFKHDGLFYAQRHNKDKGTAEVMHRVILGLEKGDPKVDHVNHNGLDNRRKNLRLATNAENAAHRRKSSNSPRRFKGVSLPERCRHWRSEIRVNRQRILLGNFVTEEEAAMRYNIAARKFFGEFAALNQVDMG